MNNAPPDARLSHPSPPSTGSHPGAVPRHPRRRATSGYLPADRPFCPLHRRILRRRSPRRFDVDTWRDCSRSLLRGGSFFGSPGVLSPGNRAWYSTDIPDFTNGFRVARGARLTLWAVEWGSWRSTEYRLLDPSCLTKGRRLPRRLRCFARPLSPTNLASATPTGLSGGGPCCVRP